MVRLFFKGIYVRRKCSSSEFHQLPNTLSGPRAGKGGAEVVQIAR